MSTRGVVAIVPARGGSKSIPRKNIKPLGRAPLIAYSIEAGLTARSVDRVIVSTDDEEIAAIARQWGADVPFVRPASLADDTTQDLPVFQHALEWLEANEGWTPTFVVQLRPTSPIRPPDCVDRAIELLDGDLTADSVRGIVLSSQNPYKMWRLKAGGEMVPLLEVDGREGYNLPRQELPVTYWQTGHIDAVRTETIRVKQSMSGTKIKGLLIDSAYTCDIDTLTDWERAEWMLTHLDRPIVRPRARQSPLPDTIRLIVFDFDGVMTDDRVWVTASGQESVACNRGDGLGLDQLRKLGIDLFVLSTETDPVVGARCRKLRLEFEQSVSDKAARFRGLLAERGIDACHAIYVGNDVNDLGCLELAGCGVAVANAHPQVLAKADLVLTRSGGHGAVRELCDLVRERVAGSSRGDGSVSRQP